MIQEILIIITSDQSHDLIASQKIKINGHHFDKSLLPQMATMAECSREKESAQHIQDRV